MTGLSSQWLSSLCSGVTSWPEQSVSPARREQRAYSWPISSAPGSFSDGCALKHPRTQGLQQQLSVTLLHRAAGVEPTQEASVLWVGVTGGCAPRVAHCPWSSEVAGHLCMVRAEGKGACENAPAPWRSGQIELHSQGAEKHSPLPSPPLPSLVGGIANPCGKQKGRRLGNLGGAVPLPQPHIP